MRIAHTHKTCSKCGEVKEILEFPKIGYRKRSTYCLKCHDGVSCRRTRPRALAISDGDYYYVNHWTTWAVGQCKKRAKKHGVPYDLSKSFLIDLFEAQNGKCYYFKVDMNRNPDFPRDPSRVSVDRVDSKKGYTQGNVVLCCAAANFAKNETNLDVFVQFLAKLRRSFRSPQYKVG